MIDDPAGLVYSRLFSDILVFTRVGSGVTLRRYQEEVAQAIVRSVGEKRGLSLVVVFPRQSGKNELQAQVEAFLLAVFSVVNAELVKVSPTWKPQSLNAMRRLERALSRNLATRREWRKESGYIYRVGRARITFLSGGPAGAARLLAGWRSTAQRTGGKTCPS